ncbi:MAG: hypothetical protein WAS33_01090, partial [Candidatus Promineifilaceae bacterium]
MSTDQNEAASSASPHNLDSTRLWLAQKIEASLPKNLALDRSPQTIKLIQERYKLARQHAKISLASADERQFFEDLLDEILGFGPLEKILNYDTITVVMVNRADLVYIEKI